MNSNASAGENFDRQTQIRQLVSGETFDLLVIGGGATGAGIAVDAASRGYRVALCEQADFGKGTSSRSTKLAHGGIRYLEQGNVRLVRDALRERGIMQRNAPHLVHRLPTIVPLYRCWEPAYYGLGLRAYDFLAGRLGFGISQSLTTAETLEALPTVKREGLRGGVRYFDGRFDDTRLLINLLQTAVHHGAVCANYARVRKLLTANERVSGAEVMDLESGLTHRVAAKVVVNAAGPYSDSVRRMATPEVESWIQPSQGTHIVLPKSFLPTENALVVPKTSDGRVVFAIPWHGHTLVGTTDTPLETTLIEPVPLGQEIEFLLKTISGCLHASARKSDILSVFAGLRPLVRKGKSQETSKLGRDHTVRTDEVGLVTVLGGKWTTYRKMAEDCVNRCAELAQLPRANCITANLPIRSAEPVNVGSRLSHYGDDAADVAALVESASSLGEPLVPELPYSVGEAVWAIRHEMARTVEDVLARRLRILFLNAAAARRAAPHVAGLLASELGHNREWVVEECERFDKLASGYLVA